MENDRITDNQTENIERPLESRRISADEFLTTSDLMRLLQIRQRRTIYKLITDGMPAIKVGRHYRFVKDEVVAFLKRSS